MAIHFYTQEIIVPLKAKRRLKTFLTELFVREKMKLSTLTYVFCDDTFLLSINQSYLKHDNLTDIITFSLNDTPSKDGIIGEVYISAQRVAENSVKYKCSFEKELHRVIFHGALHLCGYTDKKPKTKQEMTKKEDEYLNLYFGKGFT